MASSSSSVASSSTIPWKYDVFLSFRGEDTRNNFTDHLYAALRQRGFATFRDDQRLERGEEISSALLRAIEESRIAIVILSRRYADSTWCLEELAKIMDCMQTREQTVLPIFYNIDPSCVRKQTGDFEKSFDKYEETFKEKVEKWRAALTKVASLSGWHLQDKPEAEMIDNIVNDISRRRYTGSLNITGDLVGINSHLKKINEYLEIGTNDVRFIGIHGMGGIGKTTIARVLYDNLSHQYTGSSFLADIREVSEKNGLVHLQQQIQTEVLMGQSIISNKYDGKCLLSKRLRCKKVLLVLDDVNQLEQLEMLAGKHDWFDLGSRVIITTRDEHLLVEHGVLKRYRVEGLNHNEASQLFYSKAFKQKQPTVKHSELSIQVVTYAKGLPLALNVLGSHLCDRGITEWVSLLNRLKENPPKKIIDVLRISYDGLEPHDKAIFLDVACFFKGLNKNIAIDMLEKCGLFPDIGLQILVEKSLITVHESNYLWMHDLIQEMGLKIVREHHPNEPGKWSRLWLSRDIWDVLTNNTGTRAVEGIVLWYAPDRRKLNGKAFSGMSNLKLLKISNVKLTEKLEYLSNNLQFLEWHGYPSKSLPSNFEGQKLVELNMRFSHIKFLWEGLKHLEKLKIVELSHSRKLVRTPDFSAAPNIKRLNLEGCTSLVEIHQSVGVLQSLSVLNLRNCKRIKSLPDSICYLKSLEILNLYGCSLVDRLPQNLGEAKCLEELDACQTAIKAIPPSIISCTRLRRLSFNGCRGKQLKLLMLPSLARFSFHGCGGMTMLPSLASFRSLTDLNLTDCGLGSIPDDIGCLSSLVELDLSKNCFVCLPSSFKQLSKLRILCVNSVNKCQRLQYLPELPSNIEYVKAGDCASLESLVYWPDPFARASSIRFELFNCFKLADRNIHIFMWQNLQPQILFHFAVRSEVFLPGREIPNWFNLQRNASSVKIQLPLNWFNKLMGLAFFVEFNPPSSYKNNIRLCCMFHELFIAQMFDGPSNFNAKSDHIWLSYFSTSEFAYNTSLLNSGSIQAEFKFLFRKDNEYKLTHGIKRCGIRLVYQED